MKPSNRDQFHFLPSHRPPLTAGDYRLTAKVQPASTGVNLWGTTPPRRSADFSVAGDRFVLHPALLRSCFPPPSAHGDFGGVMPHLAFHRTTLPWERSPLLRVGDAPPWFALVCFRSDDAPPVTLGKVGVLLDPHAKGVFVPPRNAELADDPEMGVSVIDLPASKLNPLLPTWAELDLTAHVRTVKPDPNAPAAPAVKVAGDDAGELDGGDTSEAETGPAGEDACAVVVSRELILATATPMRWVVHLVSLEGCYTSTGAFVWGPEEPKIRLVSLFHWEFMCEAAKPDFVATAKKLDVGAFCLPAAGFAGAPARAAELGAQGSVPLPHWHREGGRSSAWFRGPLLPWTGPEQGPPARLPLPARSADALVLHERDLGMCDLSYAVAWELGRTSALANRAFSTRYAAWKRARSGSAARLRAQIDQAVLPAPAGSPPASGVELPPGCRRFLRSLKTLAAVPTTHLVPNALLLPPESLRMVRVDTTWIACLLDGAQAIGRHTAHEAARDASTTTPASGQGEIGVLLRSCLVDDFPDLEIDGWIGDDGPEAAPVPVMLDRRLGPATRLVLFAVEPVRVSLGLPPTVLHFGMDVAPDSVKVVRRSPDGQGEVRDPLSTSGDASTVQFAADGHSATVRLDRVVTDLKVKSTESAGFATLIADLMESAPRVDFTLKVVR